MIILLFYKNGILERYCILDIEWYVIILID